MHLLGWLVCLSGASAAVIPLSTRKVGDASLPRAETTSSADHVPQVIVRDTPTPGGPDNALVTPPASRLLPPPPRPLSFKQNDTGDTWFMPPYYKPGAKAGMNHGNRPPGKGYPFDETRPVDDAMDAYCLSKNENSAQAIRTDLCQSWLRGQCSHLQQPEVDHGSVRQWHCDHWLYAGCDATCKKDFYAQTGFASAEAGLSVVYALYNVTPAKSLSGYERKWLVNTQRAVRIKVAKQTALQLPDFAMNDACETGCRLAMAQAVERRAVIAAMVIGRHLVFKNADLMAPHNVEFNTAVLNATIRAMGTRRDKTTVPLSKRGVDDNFDDFELTQSFYNALVARGELLEARGLWNPLKGITTKLSNLTQRLFTRIMTVCRGMGSRARQAANEDEGRETTVQFAEPPARGAGEDAPEAEFGLPGETAPEQITGEGGSTFTLVGYYPVSWWEEISPENGEYYQDGRPVWEELREAQWPDEDYGTDIALEMWNYDNQGDIVLDRAVYPLDENMDDAPSEDDSDVEYDPESPSLVEELLDYPVYPDPRLANEDNEYILAPDGRAMQDWSVPMEVWLRSVNNYEEMLALRAEANMEFVQGALKQLPEGAETPVQPSEWLEQWLEDAKTSFEPDPAPPEIKPIPEDPPDSDASSFEPAYDSNELTDESDDADANEDLDGSGEPHEIENPDDVEDSGDNESAGEDENADEDENQDEDEDPDDSEADQDENPDASEADQEENPNDSETDVAEEEPAPNDQTDIVEEPAAGSETGVVDGADSAAEGTGIVDVSGPVADAGSEGGWETETETETDPETSSDFSGEFY
ncbi:hypothetical protein KC340_g17361 [Hortaea werneckii]|nr:hypothetical protein KC342_g16621 [Hortaea werneckii]KAI7060867.1 hypothetical protein KC339_g16981 [Hortaea werneckii]KAI7212318.1 hypothetical protein KC365_g14641 [Hortaea werneckii]KAI7290545.1 hypothetical protein KC340_g17361 [Hortaea werneckii]KAI7376795.1 hypothetical protein KC328_g14740 [Hortaea werneckii]